MSSRLLQLRLVTPSADVAAVELMTEPPHEDGGACSIRKHAKGGRRPFWTRMDASHWRRTTEWTDWTSGMRFR